MKTETKKDAVLIIGIIAVCLAACFILDFYKPEWAYPGLYKVEIPQLEWHEENVQLATENYTKCPDLNQTVWEDPYVPSFCSINSNLEFICDPSICYDYSTVTISKAFCFADPETCDDTYDIITQGECIDYCGEKWIDPRDNFIQTGYVECVNECSKNPVEMVKFQCFDFETDWSRIEEYGCQRCFKEFNDETKKKAAKGKDKPEEESSDKTNEEKPDYRKAEGKRSIVYVHFGRFREL